MGVVVVVVGGGVCCGCEGLGLSIFFSYRCDIVRYLFVSRYARRRMV